VLDEKDPLEQFDGQATVPSREQLSSNFGVPLADQAAVDKEAKEWAALWKETSNY